VPFTEPLADLPKSWPSQAAKWVNPDDTAAREIITLLRQIRAYLETVDAALKELEP
jgi:hypothetical protein